MSKNRFNGERLKQARIYRGLSINDLAEILDVSKQAISQYEKSEISPEFNKLSLIVNNLNFPPEYFFQCDSFDVETTTTYFRALISTNKINRLQQITKLKHLAIIHEVLTKYIEYPLFDISHKINIDNKSIEDFTSDLREQWGLGIDPIDDMAYLLEKNGIIVTSYTTETNNIDAYSQKITINGKDRFIVVLSNDKLSATRTQFDAAHELGHIFLHNWGIDLEELSKEEFKEIENQANEFAASFLLPKESFIRDVSLYPKDLNYYIELKRKWKVSISAMIIRAHRLDVLSFNQYQYLMRQMAFKGWRNKEPLDGVIMKPQPTLLSKSIDMLLANNIFTVKSFLDELAQNTLPLKPEDVELLLNLKKGTLKIEPISKETNILKLKNEPT